MNKIIAYFTAIVLLLSISAVYTVSAAEGVDVNLYCMVNTVQNGENTEVADGQFAFEVKSVSQNWKVDRAEYRSSKGGYVGLGHYAFYSPGTYQLAVEQINLGAKGYKYDTSTAFIYINVSDGNEGMKYTVSSTKSGINSPIAVFTNTFEETVKKQTNTENKSYKLTFSSNTNTYSPGDDISFSMTAENKGNVDINEIYARYYIPDGCTFVSVYGAGCNYGAINDKDHATWFISTLKPGESRTMTLTVKVNECAPNEIKCTPMATITNSTEKIYTNEPINPKSISSKTLKLEIKK